jgi:hypothetical protein
MNQKPEPQPDYEEKGEQSFWELLMEAIFGGKQ